VSKKTGKPIKPRKPEKKTEKTEPKFFFFWKNRPVQFGFGFGFITKKPNRTEPKPTKNQKKPSQTGKTEPKPSQTEKNRAKTRKTEPNRFEPVFALKNRTEPNRTETGQFDPVSVRFRFFFKKKFRFDYFFW
jgi:hypothetical protein